MSISRLLADLAVAVAVAHELVERVVTGDWDRLSSKTEDGLRDRRTGQGKAHRTPMAGSSQAVVAAPTVREAASGAPSGRP